MKVVDGGFGAIEGTSSSVMENGGASVLVADILSITEEWSSR